MTIENFPTIRSAEIDGWAELINIKSLANLAEINYNTLYRRIKGGAELEPGESDKVRSVLASFGFIYDPGQALIVKREIERIKRKDQ